MANEVLKNDTSIVLDWADVSGADRYHLQVALYPDFSGVLLEDDNTLAVSTKSFTDGGADAQKRWWRWRYSTNTGTTWSEWRDVASYWLDSTAAGDVTVANGKFAMFDPDLVTDIFTWTEYPNYTVRPLNINRAKVRNRLGELLSEYLTTKDMISLDFDDTRYMAAELHAALVRFHVEIKTFYLGSMRYNGVDYIPNIWLVQFVDDPELTMVASGREDLLVGTLELEEV